MGLQSTYIENGASVLVIEQACDNDQLLVSLSKNETQWLSPVGWTDQQKVTLLDCRANGQLTEIDIPSEFARDIKSGDVLVLRCSELDIEKEIIWEASEVETRAAEEIVPAATGLAGGLLSRFKGSKAEPTLSTKSETELRAEEAGRAADNFKVKMEAATAAKEDAQRRALEAAREAEVALKMEANRIAEMERAAKAFEEAERLKQDELRRVDEERRAEEARLAEEARRIEEARKREIAAKKEAERKEALKRYEAALDITRNEEVRLKGRLKDLKRQVKTESDNLSVQQDDLDSRRGHLVTAEDVAGKHFVSFEKSASKLDVMATDLSVLQAESETLDADRKDLSSRLSQADEAYQTAQKEAEAAMARAKAKRAELEAIRTKEGAVSGKLSKLSEKLSAQSHLVAGASEKSHKLQVKYDQSQADLARAKVEIEAVEQALAVQVEKDRGLRLEIEATQQAIDDSQAREANHRVAIEHLEAGGSPDEVASMEFEARSFEPSKNSKAGDISSSLPAVDSVGFKDRMMGRVRRNFSREKDVEISIDVEDVILTEADKKADAVLLAGIDDTPSFMRRHGSSLMALGAVIGGIAILGGGLAMNKTSQPTLQVKSSTPAPTQVASVVTKVELPKIVAVKEDVKAVTEIPNEKLEAIPSEAASEETAKIKVPAIEIVTEKALLESVTKEPISDDSLSIVKLAAVIDPTGFAFELPDMMPKAQPKKLAAKAVKAKPKKVAAKTSAPKAVKAAAVTTAKPKAANVVNYPELTTEVQMQLSELGFYSGQIDGLQNKATQTAIKDFKSLFGMAETDEKISGALLTELKRAKREQELAVEQAQKLAEIEAASVQMAEVTPSAQYYDTLPAVPALPVVTDSLPAAEPMPSYAAPQPAPVQMASIPAVQEATPTPVMQDVIVPAKVTRNASAEYPAAAARREYFVNVAIVVAYDIGVDGRVTNLNIVSNDHSGRYNVSFEKEALRAVEKLRYDPKTVNGTAVPVSGEQKRIVFRAG